MRDRYGREIDYMRISLTENCNLHCSYCRPETVLQEISGQMTTAEILRLCRIFAEIGVRKFKLTGGEPLLRRDLYQLIAGIKQIEGVEQVTLTTNGVLLGRKIDALLAAGIDGVNISLDTLDPLQYKRLTGSDQLQLVLDGFCQLVRAGFPNIKINSVLLAGKNEDQVLALAGLAKDQAVAVRFIELMPLGIAAVYRGIRQRQIMQTLTQAYGPFSSCSFEAGNGPARYFSLPGFSGRIGFIDAIGHKFCRSCNRVRLTADGFLKLCLQYRNGLALLPLLRSGLAEDEVRQLIQKQIYIKPREHHLCEGLADLKDDRRRMFQIGG